nr:hypothetical protein [Kineosphaera limosa]
MIRSRGDLHRWSAANAHGAQMHQGVDLLEAAETDDPAEVFAVTQRAIKSATTLIMRADDSSGIIGSAVQRLLALHARTAAPAGAPVFKLVPWLMKFQFEQECDFFHVDPVAYAPALGDTGMVAYRRALAERRALLGPEPAEEDSWQSPASHDWFTIHYNDQRLAVFDRDVEAIIRTHARDERVAAWVEDAAQALEEIEEYDLAIEWTERAVRHPNGGHQSITAARYLGELLKKHRPDALLAARLDIFDRWPSATHANEVREAAGSGWADLSEMVLSRLQANPRQAVSFALLCLKEPQLAWTLAYDLGLDDASLWSELLKAYEKVDPLATVQKHTELAIGELAVADARNYRAGARRLARLRKLVAGTSRAVEVDDLIATLRDEHRRRPRLQQEFTKAGLP